MRGERKISRHSGASANAASSSSDIFASIRRNPPPAVVLEPASIDFGPPRASPQASPALAAFPPSSSSTSSARAIRLPQKRQFTSSSAASGDLNSDSGFASDTIMADASNTWRTGQPTSHSSHSNGNGNGVAKSSNRGKSKGGRGRGRGGPNAKAVEEPNVVSGPQGSQSVGRPGQPPKKKLSKAQAELDRLPVLPGAAHSMDYLTNAMYAMVLASGKVKDKWVENPKNPLATYFERHFGEQLKYTRQVGRLESATEKSFRVTVEADRELGITGYGDATSIKEAEKFAAFDAVMQLAERDLLDRRPERLKDGPVQNGAAASAAAAAAAPAAPLPTLTSGIALTLDRAREFMDFYCHEFKFGKPVIEYSRVAANKSAAGGRKKAKNGNESWQADMIVGQVSVGKGIGTNKKLATQNCYIDTVLFIEQSDPQLYARFHSTHKPGAPITAAAHVYFRLSDQVHEDIRDVIGITTQSLLYSKRPQPAASSRPGRANAQGESSTPHKKRVHTIRMPSSAWLAQKSDELMARLQRYQTDDRVADMRRFRSMLPVTQNIADILTKVALHQVSICMAATGSGKSTQVPQILLDDAILEGKGAECNIICTQPRRIAAISLAQRVANERGEQVGDSVGYQVRFEQKLPRPHGSITFCTTGSFMKRLQNALGDDSKEARTWLDTITHVVIDEVHERDVQTDLLLVVLKKVLDQRRTADKRDIRLILMSATVDPKLFQNYFPDRFGRPAPVVEIPGRAFPVERYFMEETVPRLQSLNLPLRAGGWVWQQKNVKDYLHRELQLRGGLKQGQEGADVIDDLEIPYPLVSLYIADAMTRGEDGHVLVFLPGWDEIKAVLNILTDSGQFPLLGMDFNDRSRFEIHILHSTVPVADQQAVFSPPPQGVRRIILSTNIAETSVTIPDVTVVVDTGRVKEMRYDPSRHLSSLVSAWVGTSNLSQRAGRAGRHRPGEYFGVLSKARHDQLAVNQTVEMQRAELTDVVLHIKALDLAGMEPEEVLASAIEPPSAERVSAAMEQLYMIGALDTNKSLTSLGHLLLQLPVNAAMGKMILYGLFFRCVEPTVTLAAILTSREPFLSSIDLKAQVSAAKESWSPSDYRSDALATLRAYQAWSEIDRRGDRGASMRFCHHNYLHQNTLLDIQRLAKHLVQSLQGIMSVILGDSEGSQDVFSGSGRYVPPRGGGFGRGRLHESAPELNRNSNCTPLLASLIAMASAPNFAIRKGEKTYQTSQDKVTFISPASVCHPKHAKGKEDETVSLGDKELFTFAEKSRNVSQVGGGGAMTMLRTVTRLDPLTYMIFGSHQIRGTQDGVICDDWLPMRGFMGALWDVDRLKHVMDASMLRVFEGIGSSLAVPSNQTRSSNGVSDGWDDPGATNDQDNDDDSPQAFGDRSDLTLARREADEFKELIDGIVRILDGYAAERASIASSRNSTRPSSPGVGLNLGHSLGIRQGQAYGDHPGGAPMAPSMGRVVAQQPRKFGPPAGRGPPSYHEGPHSNGAYTSPFGNGSGYPSPAAQSGPPQSGPPAAYPWW